MNIPPGQLIRPRHPAPLIYALSRLSWQEHAPLLLSPAPRIPKQSHGETSATVPVSGEMSIPQGQFVFFWITSPSPYCQISVVFRLADSPRNRASDPVFVPDLADLPTGNVTQISAGGGYVFAALTAGNDAYVWGVGEGLSGSPEPLDLDGEDVLDIAVGETHILALTADGRVWIWGKGANGQLGLGTREEVEEWETIPVSIPAGRKIVGVAAGERSSFLIIKIEGK